MKKIWNWVSILLLIFIVILVTFVLRNGTYTNDEWWIINLIKSLDNDFIKLFLTSDQGQFFSWVTLKFLLIDIPNIFNIEPQQNISLAIARGIVIALLTLLFSLFFDISKKRIPNPITIIFNASIIFSLCFFFDNVCFFLLNQNLKYILNLIIGYSIWYIWFGDFLNNEFWAKKHLLRDCFFTVCIVWAGHIVNIPSLIICLGLLFYSNYIENQNNRFKNFLNLLKSKLPIILIYVSLMLVYINLPGFTAEQVKRIPHTNIIEYSITHFFNYSKLLFTYIFSNLYLTTFLIITIAGIAILFYNRKKFGTKYGVIASSIFLSQIFFIYTLLTCGTTYYDGKSYWFESKQLMITFIFYEILILNVVLGSIFKLLETPRKKVAFILLCFISTSCLFPINTFITNFSRDYNKLNSQQVAIYKLSKVVRYYDLKDQLILFPYQYFCETNPFGGFDWTLDIIIENTKRLYNIEYRKEVILIHKRILNENELFTEDEIKHINFKKLRDDSFILQMKEPIYEEWHNQKTP